jgi:hypothetical protein
MGLELGRFRKCLFGIPRNTEFYAELTLFRIILQIFLLYIKAKVRGILYWFMYTEFCIPSNENSSIKKLKKSTKEWCVPQNSAEFCKGSCIQNSVYLWMSSVLNRLKNQSIKKNFTTEFRYTRSRGIPRNSVEFDEFLYPEIQRNSAEFRAIVYYTEFTELKKHTECLISGIPKTP